MRRVEELIYKEIITEEELSEIKADKRNKVKFIEVVIIEEKEHKHYTVTLNNMDFHIYVK